MAISKRPIFSIDKPQNRFTLNNEGFYYESFEKLVSYLESNPSLDMYIVSDIVNSKYSWTEVVSEYQSLY